VLTNASSLFGFNLAALDIGECSRLPFTTFLQLLERLEVNFISSEDTSLREYIHQQLGPGQIRLLRIHRRTAQQPFRLRCEFVFVSVDAVPPYEAISHAWGSRSTFKDIVLNDVHRSPVPSRVHRLLRHRRSFVSSKLIWIDAICIDQNNSREREKQVQMMGEIFSKASRVLAWLASPEEAPKSGLLVQSSRDVRLGLEHGLPSQLFTYILRRDHLVVLRDFFSNPWFSRVWMVQEVALPPKVQVICGSTCIDWSGIDAMAQIAGEVPVGSAMEDVLHTTVDAQLMRRSRNISNVGIISHLRDRIGFDRERKTSGEHPFVNVLDSLPLNMPQGDRKSRLRWINAAVQGYVSLEELMMGTREFDSTDERDKVFAVLGMVLNPPMAAHLPRPDYHSHFSEIYRKTAESVFRSSAVPAFILVLAGVGLRRFQELTANSVPPCWVPDLRCPQGHLSAVTIREHVEKPTGEDSEMQITLGQDGRSLEILTALVDEIVEVGPVHKDPSLTGSDFEGFSWQESMRRWHSRLQETKAMALRKNSLQSHMTHKHIIDEYWRTLFLNRISGTSGDAELSTSNLIFIKEKFELSMAIYSQLESTTSDPWNNPKLQKILEGDVTQVITFARVLHSLKINTMGRRFCRTRNGHFAIVPPLVERRDVVCFFQGSNGAWLLRPVAHSNVPGSKRTSASSESMQRYQFVGSCYVRKLEYPQPRSGSGSEFRPIVIV
jgi:Heterokaryon incompatibility protein (HET)